MPQMQNLRVVDGKTNYASNEVSLLKLVVLSAWPRVEKIRCAATAVAVRLRKVRAEQGAWNGKRARSQSGLSLVGSEMVMWCERDAAIEMSGRPLSNVDLSGTGSIDMRIGGRDSKVQQMARLLHAARQGSDRQDCETPLLNLARPPTLLQHSHEDATPYRAQSSAHRLFSTPRRISDWSYVGTVAPARSR